VKVLIACEQSGTVRRAFRAVGHEAYSCDLMPAEDQSLYHIQGDVLDVIDQDWDLVIAHPPCTYLSIAGARWLYPKGVRSEDRYALLVEGAAFFNRILSSSCKKVCIENPRMLVEARALITRPYDQTIQPWMFGDKMTKTTHLWLKGLLPLEPMIYSMPHDTEVNWSKRKKGSHSGKARSVTFDGIAHAMALQWGTSAPVKVRQQTLFEMAV
jgi:site-specific DNA-cytosine methylase